MWLDQREELVALASLLRLLWQSRGCGSIALEGSVAAA
jgi:hypothetical protein